VRVEDMQQGYWQKRFNGAQRIETTVKNDWLDFSKAF
jgi:hypothetical protein